MQTSIHAIRNAIRNSLRIPAAPPIAAAASLASIALHAPVAAQDRPLSGDFAELCRIGGTTAAEWAFFEGESSIGFDAAGNLHILDDGAGRIVVADSQCELVRTVGRKGEGPGEFNQATLLAVWRDGRVAVMDLGHSAYQVFGSGGEFERFVRMGTGQGPIAIFSGMRRAIRAEPGGEALIAQGPPAAAQRMSAILAQQFGGGGQEAGVDDRGLERLALAGDVVSATPVLQGWQPAREAADELNPADMTNPTALIGNMMDGQYGFEPGFHWDLLPDGTIVWSDSTAYAIKFASPGGPVSDVVERPFAPEPVTEPIRQQLIERSLVEMEEALGDPQGTGEMAAALMPGMMATMRKSVEEMKFRDEVPVVRRLKASWNGGLWVQRRGEEPWDDDGPIDVFGPERNYVGTFDATNARIPAAFGPDGVVAYWEFDELDVPTIVLMRLPEEVR